MARRRERLEGRCAPSSRLRARRWSLHVGDVTQRADLDAAVALAIERYGRLDMAVANAGFGVVGTVEKLARRGLPPAIRDQRVRACSRRSRRALPELRKSRGRLVLIGSVAGYISMPNASPYAMSKFAVRALALALEQELAPYGVTVTLISPGFIVSEIRQVDNRGVHHAFAKDPLPSWLTMPTDVAAKKIVSAAYRRRREAIITLHGKAAGVPPAVRAVGAAARRCGRGVRGRAEPKR